MTRRRSGRSGREHLAAIDGSRAGVARKGLLLEFTVDHPELERINADQLTHAHEASLTRSISNQRAILDIHLTEPCPKQQSFAGVHFCAFRQSRPGPYDDGSIAGLADNNE